MTDLLRALGMSLELTLWIAQTPLQKFLTAYQDHQQANGGVFLNYFNVFLLNSKYVPPSDVRPLARLLQPLKPSFCGPMRPSDSLRASGV